MTIKFASKHHKQAFALIVKKRLAGVYMGNGVYGFTEEQVKEFRKARIPYQEIKFYDKRSKQMKVA